MQQVRRAIQAIFVITLAVALLGGALFVAGQALALVLGQGPWLEFLNESLKAPICIAASICAVAGFLLSYGARRKQPQEAHSR